MFVCVYVCVCEIVMDVIQADVAETSNAECQQMALDGEIVGSEGVFTISCLHFMPQPFSHIHIFTRTRIDRSSTEHLYTYVVCLSVSE